MFQPVPFREFVEADPSCLAPPPAPAPARRVRTGFAMPGIRLPLFALLLLGGVAAAVAKTAPPPAAAPVKQLLAVLASGADETEKAAACRELGRLGARDAIAPLAALLPNERLSHMARYALETIPDPAVEKALRDAAGQLQGHLRVGVIGSIGVRRDVKAVRLLTRLLRDPDSEVAQAAARSLGRIGNATAAQALLDALPKAPAGRQPTICDGLLRCAEEQSALGNHKRAIRIYDRLRTASNTPPVRAAALRGAILARKQEGWPLLKASIRAGDLDLFLVAIAAANEMPGAEVTHILTDALAGQGADRQVLLIQALARRGDAAALPALCEAARSGDTTVRVAALRTAAEFGRAAALPVFLDLMGDSDPDIAAAAQDGLARLPGREADDAIIRLLTDGPSAQRGAALDLIARRRMASAVPALFAAATGAEPELRLAAIRKLGELAEPSELPRLLDLLAGAANPAEVEAAEQAIRAVSLKAPASADCVSQVEARLAQASPPRKCALLRVLGALGGPRALSALRGALSDPNPEIRATAIRVLGDWGTADAAPDLLALARSATTATDQMICLRGCLRLAGLPDLPVDQRLAMCREAAALASNDEGKKLLLAALGTLTSVEAVDLALPYLDEPGTREEASSAVVEMAARLLKGQNAARLAARLLGPLDKAGQATLNDDLAKRARALLDQAKAKAG